MSSVTEFEGNEAMSPSEGRRSPVKTSVETDLDKTLTELLSGRETSEPVRIGKKIVKTLDSETTIEYELAVDPRTGQQQVVEHIKTTKQECGRCGRLTSQLKSCRFCTMNVCGACITTYIVEGGYSNTGVCLSCLDGITKTSPKSRNLQGLGKAFG
jgi:hypothetical protein